MSLLFVVWPPGEVLPGERNFLNNLLSQIQPELLKSKSINERGSSWDVTVSAVQEIAGQYSLLILEMSLVEADIYDSSYYVSYCEVLH
jgi:hypothetical protein